MNKTECFYFTAELRKIESHYFDWVSSLTARCQFFKDGFTLSSFCLLENDQKKNHSELVEICIALKGFCGLNFSEIELPVFTEMPQLTDFIAKNLVL